MSTLATKKRIGLFTPVAGKKKAGRKTTSTTYVEIGTAAELAEKLAALGAKRAGLLCRDRLGTTRNEGGMFPLAELKESHVEWVTAEPPQFETRGIYYETK